MIDDPNRDIGDVVESGFEAGPVGSEREFGRLLGGVVDFFGDFLATIQSNGFVGSWLVGNFEIGGSAVFPDLLLSDRLLV